MPVLKTPMPRSDQGADQTVDVALDNPMSAPASNEDHFEDATAAVAPRATAGWDPYEVWRTRVFALRPIGYKKDRENT